MDQEKLNTRPPLISAEHGNISNESISTGVERDAAVKPGPEMNPVSDERNVGTNDAKLRNKSLRLGKRYITAQNSEDERNNAQKSKKFFFSNNAGFSITLRDDRDSRRDERGNGDNHSHQSTDRFDLDLNQKLEQQILRQMVGEDDIVISVENKPSRQRLADSNFKVDAQRKRLFGFASQKQQREIFPRHDNVDESENFAIPRAGNANRVECPSHSDDEYAFQPKKKDGQKKLQHGIGDYSPRQFDSVLPERPTSIQTNENFGFSEFRVTHLKKNLRQSHVGETANVVNQSYNPNIIFQEEKAKREMRKKLAALHYDPGKEDFGGDRQEKRRVWKKVIRNDDYIAEAQDFSISVQTNPNGIWNKKSKNQNGGVCDPLEINSVQIKEKRASADAHYGTKSVRNESEISLWNIMSQNLPRDNLAKCGRVVRFKKK